MDTTTRIRAIIVGAPRSGTTTLWRQLARHPEIAPSRIKELNFLTDENIIGTDYDNHFEAGGLATLEASPVYFREHSEIAPRLAKRFPEARLIFILREPAARLLAGFRSARDWDRNIAPGIGFDDFVRIITEDLDPLPIFPNDRTRAVYATEAKKVGLYAEILQHYLQHFRPEQMHILFLEDINQHPTPTLASICEHIGVSSKNLPHIHSSIENKGVEVKNILLFTYARRINKSLEPILNSAPWLRLILRKIHHSVNAKPADRSSKSTAEALARAQKWYSEPNKKLAALISEKFPDLEMPNWLRGNID